MDIPDELKQALKGLMEDDDPEQHPEKWDLIKEVPATEHFKKMHAECKKEVELLKSAMLPAWKHKLLEKHLRRKRDYMWSQFVWDMEDAQIALSDHDHYDEKKQTVRSYNKKAS